MAVGIHAILIFVLFLFPSIAYFVISDSHIAINCSLKIFFHNISSIFPLYSFMIFSILHTCNKAFDKLGEFVGSFNLL